MMNDDKTPRSPAPFDDEVTAIESVPEPTTVAPRPPKKQKQKLPPEQKKMKKASAVSRASASPMKASGPRPATDRGSQGGSNRPPRASGATPSTSSRPRAPEPSSAGSVASSSTQADTGRLGRMLDQQERLVAAHGGLIEQLEADAQLLRGEAQRLDERYQKLLDGLTSERDALTQRLSKIEVGHAEAMRAHTQTAREMERRLLQARADAEQRLELTTRRASRFEREVADLREQLREALDSRDRVAERVRAIETKLETTVIPLREELDAARERELELKGELMQARSDLKGMGLLIRKPER